MKAALREKLRGVSIGAGGTPTERIPDQIQQEDRIDRRPRTYNPPAMKTRLHLYLGSHPDWLREAAKQAGVGYSTMSQIVGGTGGYRSHQITPAVEKVLILVDALSPDSPCSNPADFPAGGVPPQCRCATTVAEDGPRSDPPTMEKLNRDVALAINQLVTVSRNIGALIYSLETAEGILRKIADQINTNQKKS